MKVTTKDEISNFNFNDENAVSLKKFANDLDEYRNNNENISPGLSDFISQVLYTNSYNNPNFHHIVFEKSGDIVKIRTVEIIKRTTDYNGYKIIGYLVSIAWRNIVENNEYDISARMDKGSVEAILKIMGLSDE